MKFFTIWIVCLVPLFSQNSWQFDSEYQNEENRQNSWQFDPQQQHNENDYNNESHRDKSHNEVIIKGEAIYFPQNKEDYCYSLFGLSFLGPSAFGATLELPGRFYDIIGLRINLLFGEHQNLYGLGIGSYNYLSESLHGIEIGMLNVIHNLHVDYSHGGHIGIVNATLGDLYGFQVGGVNYGKGFVDWQIGAFNWIANSKYDWDFSRNILGAQIGIANLLESKNKIAIAAQFSAIINYNEGNIYGIQVSSLNHCQKIYGCQIGIVNGSSELHGLQIGLVNVSAQMKGVQIGLVNFVYKDFTLLPFINVHF